MPRLILFFIILLSCYSEVLKAQHADDEMTKFSRFAPGKLDFSQFPDSSAMYTCKLVFTVDKKNRFTSIISNDSTVSNRIKDINDLMQFDFSTLRGKKKSIVLQVPILVVILDSKKGKKQIDSHLIAEKIRMLYVDADSKYHIRPNSLLMFPIMVTLDKTVYY